MTSALDVLLTPSTARTALVPAPVGSHGPITRQKAGSGGGAYAPPALGLPSTTKTRMASPMPIVPAMTIRNVVNAPAAKMISAPSHRSPSVLEGRRSAMAPMARQSAPAQAGDDRVEP